MIIQQALREAHVALQAISETAQLDAEVLLMHCLQVPRSTLWAWPERALTTQQSQHYQALVALRETGQPVAYLAGKQEFWSLSLEVTPDTLIPRADTETLVEAALEYMQQHTVKRILDLGTGSGAIALALASEHPECEIIAIDNSKAALAVAKRNSQSLHISNITFLYSHWCAELNPHWQADLIVSNPPYISPDDPHLKRGEVRFEPLSALSSKAAGFADIEQIIRQVRPHLKPQSYLYLEHGWQQSEQVTRLLQQNSYTSIRHRQDLAGHIRVTGAMF